MLLRQFALLVRLHGKRARLELWRKAAARCERKCYEQQKTSVLDAQSLLGENLGAQYEKIG